MKKNLFEKEHENQEDILQNIEVSRELVKKTNETLNSEIEKLLSLHLRNLFSQKPEVKRYRWQQYRNYWNDGDTCYFHIRREGFYLKDQEKLFPEFGDDLICMNDYEYPDGFKENPEYQNLIQAEKKLSSFLHQYDDYLESIYGNDSQITVYPDGTLEVKEYSNHN
jgi:hypothetical protein